jgi:uncharacterized membrane protein
MNTFSKIVVIGALAAAIGGAFAQTTTTTTPAAPATASTPTALDADFAQKHPRIAEVLGRLRNERERIAADLKVGKITEDQAEALMEKARKIHREELRDVRKNDGSLTKEEQEKLNTEENILSKRIHHDVTKTADKKEDKAEKSDKGEKSDKSEKSDHGKSSKK